MLLAVTNLRVTLNTSRGSADALRAVPFAIQRGGKLGLIDESGCGKLITALALMGLLPESATLGGSIRYGQELAALDLNRVQVPAVLRRRLAPVQSAGDAAPNIPARDVATAG